MQTIVTLYMHDTHPSVCGCFSHKLHSKGMHLVILSWKIEGANYLPQMALCNSGKIAVTYYNMYLPTTDAAVQQHLLYM